VTFVLLFFRGMSLTSIIIRLRCFIIIPLNLYWYTDGCNRNENNKDRNIPRGFLKNIYHLSIVAAVSWEILYWLYIIIVTVFIFSRWLWVLTICIIRSTRRFLCIFILNNAKALQRLCDDVIDNYSQMTHVELHILWCGAYALHQYTDMECTGAMFGLHISYYF